MRRSHVRVRRHGQRLFAMRAEPPLHTGPCHVRRIRQQNVEARRAAVPPHARPPGRAGERDADTTREATNARVNPLDFREMRLCAIARSFEVQQVRG